MIALLLLTILSFGADVYVNGTYVDSRSLAGNNFQRVDVAVDADGVIHITAPGYKVEVVGGGSPPPRPTSIGMGTPPPLSGATASNNGVPRATWWLVTEDNGSTGHSIDLIINGTPTHTLRSGEQQKILDIGSYLKPGANDVLVRSMSSNASGGTFYIYLGTGSDQSGTVVMDTPQVQFGVGSSRSGSYERQYNLSVQ